MATIFILERYNNYFNQIKKPPLATLTDYANAAGEFRSYQNANFNPGDGVTASFVMNTAGYGVNEFNPDYFVCEDINGTLSRWFVLESKCERNGQHILSLKRDVIADFYEEVINAPCFIQKATLDSDNPLIFNNEGMTFNQIKKSETLLKDASDVAWLVGYVSVPTDSTAINVTKPVAVQYDYTRDSYPFAYLYSGVTDLEDLYNNPKRYTGKPQTIDITFRTKELTYIREYNQGIGYTRTIETNNWLGCTFDANITRKISNVNRTSKYGTTGYYLTANINNGGAPIYPTLEEIQDLISEKVITSKNDILAGLQTQLGYNDENASEFLNSNGKIIYDSVAQKYYQIIITAKDQQIIDTDYNSTDTNNLATALKYVANQVVLANTSVVVSNVGEHHFGIKYTAQSYQFQLIDVTSSYKGLSVQISADRKILEDAPYSMFCIPYGKIGITGISNRTVYSNEKTSIEMATAIATKLGSALYDLQLLPYCPCLHVLVDEPFFGVNKVISISGLTEHTNYEVIKDGNNGVGVLLWCDKSTGSFNIECERYVEEVKIENETSFYRIVSPNYQGIFEFNLAKNGGMQYVNVDYTYKPYNPYIHINPDFSNLYGQDFNDARGLICGGDFSVAVVNNAWEQYQINNKNFQTIFDRGIESQDFHHSMTMVQSSLNALGGTAQGAVMGAMAGGVAGGIAGGVASAIGGAADLIMQDEIYRQDKRYQKDIFNYQLGNIKAMPQSLTKSSALTANNKLFPFLEYYSCTDVEKEALRNKLKYSGMTVMVTGKIADYLRPETTYIQGQIIRIENISEDAHIINEIANEIAKGVYI